jgi:hypothetical protein
MRPGEFTTTTRNPARRKAQRALFEALEGRQLLSGVGELSTTDPINPLPVAGSAPGLPVAGGVPASGQAVKQIIGLNSLKLKRSPLLMETVIPVNRSGPMGPVAPGTPPVLATPTLTAPLLGLSVAAYDKATIYWGDVPDEEVYHILRSTDGVNFTQVGTAPINAQVYVDATVAADTAYVYKVVAVAEGHNPGTSAPMSVRTYAAPEGLKVEFGPRGVKRLTFNGITLVDTVAHPEDGLSVEAYEVPNPDGTTKEVFIGDSGTTTVDPSENSITRTFAWGSVKVYYTQEGDRLRIGVVVTNTSDQPVAGVHVFPMAVRFPAFPVGWNGETPWAGFNSDGPTAIAADFGAGKLVLANEDVHEPLYVGMITGPETAATRRFRLWVASSDLSYQPPSWPRFDRPIGPGETDAYTVSLRFGQPHQETGDLTQDVTEEYVQQNPPTLNWADRRPIGQLMLSSSAPWHHSATNPRGWFNDPSVDVTTDAGKREFKQRLLAYADRSIGVLRATNAQGAIVWDIEGQEYLHPVSYVGDPGLMGARAPEMEFEGAADAFFQRFRDAGLRVGVAVRAQEFAWVDGRPVQQWSDDPKATLARKIRYAHDRWGVTMFYIDSNATSSYVELDAELMRELSAEFPDVLLVPELENTKYYGFTAPYVELLRDETGTPDAARSYHGDAFSLINVAEGDARLHWQALVEQVGRGDVLLFRAWFDSPESHTVLDLYEEAALL